MTVDWESKDLRQLNLLPMGCPPVTPQVARLGYPLIYLQAQPSFPRLPTGVTPWSTPKDAAWIILPGYPFLDTPSWRPLKITLRLALISSPGNPPATPLGYPLGYP